MLRPRDRFAPGKGAGLKRIQKSLLTLDCGKAHVFAALSSMARAGRFVTYLLMAEAFVALVPACADAPLPVFVGGLLDQPLPGAALSLIQVSARGLVGIEKVNVTGMPRVIARRKGHVWHGSQFMRLQNRRGIDRVNVTGITRPSALWNGHVWLGSQLMALQNRRVYGRCCYGMAACPTSSYLARTDCDVAPPLDATGCSASAAACRACGQARNSTGLLCDVD